MLKKGLSSVNGFSVSVQNIFPFPSLRHNTGLQYTELRTICTLTLMEKDNLSVLGNRVLIKIGIFGPKTDEGTWHRKRH